MSKAALKGGNPSFPQQRGHCAVRWSLLVAICAMVNKNKEDLRASNQSGKSLDFAACHRT